MIPISFLFLLIPLKIISLIIATRGTFSGQLKPNRVSLFCWSLAPLIGFIIAFTHGAYFSATPLLLAGLAPLFILILTFFTKYAPWKIHLSDYLGGVLSMIAIFFWITVNDPARAILFLITADLFASLPTIRKAWKDPKTESLTVYALGILGNSIGLATLKTWNISTSGFSIYLIILGIIMIIAIMHRMITKKLSTLLL